MDLEMTGLDPDRHVVVEIATLITDDDLRVIAEGPELVIHQPPAAMASMDDFVEKMHTKSGLLDQIAESTISLRRREGPDLGLSERTHLRSRDRPTVRQLDRHRSSFLGKTPFRNRELPALPLGRCVDDQGAGASVVPQSASRCAEESRRTSCPRRHQGVDRRTRVLPLVDVSTDQHRGCRGCRRYRGCRRCRGSRHFRVDQPPTSRGQICSIRNPSATTRRQGRARPKR